MKKSNLSQTTVRRRARSSGELLRNSSAIRLSVHFTVIPDEERLLLVDQNEDRQVTSLVQKLLCGETFKPEDFQGGDQSFSPKFKVPDAA
ncbi:BnaC05g30550D [Brassica napus]|uniref:BnaC05g30550D protein n=1 Tax=Brassica napus TaxID=3708 RepID=A0A078I5A1_BRANA|nr:BnaC05g30550D [Brassica napus]